MISAIAPDAIFIWSHVYSSHAKKKKKEGKIRELEEELPMLFGSLNVSDAVAKNMLTSLSLTQGRKLKGIVFFIG